MIDTNFQPQNIYLKVPRDQTNKYLDWANATPHTTIKDRWDQKDYTIWKTRVTRPRALDMIRLSWGNEIKDAEAFMSKDWSKM